MLWGCGAIFFPPRPTDSAIVAPKSSIDSFHCGAEMGSTMPTDGGRLRGALHRVFPTARNVLIRRSLRCIDFGGVTSVLVVGAGEDPYRGLFNGVHRYVALDITRGRRDPDVVGDGAALPFHDGGFDCVLATEVLEYVADPVRFAGELHRVLKSGGMAVITVPFLFHDHHDYWRPTRRGLIELFRGFSSTSVYAQGNRLHTAFDLLTTSFAPRPVLFPIRVLSNLMFLSPSPRRVRDSHSSAPTGFLLIARK